ncbi:FUSC family protein [Desulfitobacterium sp. THU1]|uniref:FUSC family protein n=1 Tax=Desulfitobacterium sp. THU1 TaxID=3138072 RepID=UPI00311EDFD7
MPTSINNSKINNITIIQNAIGASLACELSKIAGSSHPYLAPLAVIICLHATLGESILHGYLKIIGTFLGALATGFIAPYIGSNAWSIGLVVLLGMGMPRLLALSNEVGNHAAISALLILAFHNNGGYTIDRVRDTIIGVFIAILVKWVVGTIMGKVKG